MYIHLFLLSFIVSGCGAWFVMKFGDRMGISDVPNPRSSHSKVIPKGGGIGILIALILASMFLSIPVGLWLSSLFIALISLWGGDKHRLPVEERLFCQFACSLFFLVLFLNSKQIDLSAYLFCVPISIFMVGTSNFYNFMDGIDGIAGLTGVVAFGLLFVYTRIIGTGDIYAVLCLIMVFSCLGFLCFNMPNAKVFLGDIGSILLGFFFSCMVIVLSESVIDFFIMVGFLAPFYFDELFTMIVRIKNKDSLLVAHRRHVYQLLVNELGICHWKVSLSYGLIQLMIGVSLIAIKPKGISFIVMAYMAFCLILSVSAIIIHKKASIK